MIEWRYQDSRDDRNWREIGYYAYFDFQTRLKYENNYGGSITNGDIYALASVFKHSSEDEVWQLSHFENDMISEIEDITHKNPYMLMFAVEQTINNKISMYGLHERNMVFSKLNLGWCDMFSTNAEVFGIDNSEFEPIFQYNAQRI